MRSLKIFFEFLWKGLAVGFLNLAALMLIGAVLTSSGIQFPEVKVDYNFIMLTTFLSGFIISIISGIIVKKLKLPRIGVFFSIYLMLFLNSVTQLLEAIYFAPGIVSWEFAPALFGQQFLMYLFVSAGIALLYKYEGPKNEADIKLARGFSGWLWRIIASACSYVLFYFVFGSINAKLFTGEYYRSQVSGLSLPSTAEILMLEPVRAVILVLSVIPIIMSLTVSKRARMIIVGTVLFVIGGLLPMLQQINTLPTVIIVASTVEMFFQFFLTGVVTTFILLYEKDKSKGVSIMDISK